MVMGYIIYQIRDSLGATGGAAHTIGNITTGFADSVNLILVAVTIFVLAVAISALFLLRQQ